jgi:hypothetical protein
LSKLGSFPCYDPSKVRVAGGTACRWYAALQTPAAPAFCSSHASRPLRFMLCCCHWCLLSIARESRVCCDVLHAVPQDMIIPPMSSPNKYHASPLLGAPTYKRHILAFFNVGACKFACLCVLLVRGWLG